MADLFAGCSFLQASSTTTNETLGTTSVPLDDIEQKCNELMEEAAQATELKVDLQHTSSIKVTLTTNGGFPTEITFPIVTPGTVSETHRRVFSTLARIIGGHGVSKVSKLEA